MKINREEIKHFFLTNEIFLKENYPGIKIKRLYQLFEECQEQSSQLIYEKLLQAVPLAYISGRSYFYNSDFYVTPDTLIPRFETEILVELAIKFLDKKKDAKVLDIGTGSGCILLSIILQMSSSISYALGTDISFAALEIAKKNCEHHLQLLQKIKQKSLNFPIDWLLADIAEGVSETFDLIVSNPPYIKTNDDIHWQVRKFEPACALYTPDDYERFFKKLFLQVNNLLNVKGMFIMEGSEHHLKSLLQLAQDNYPGSQWSIVKDYLDRDRFLIGVRRNG